MLRRDRERNEGNGRRIEGEDNRKLKRGELREYFKWNYEGWERKIVEGKNMENEIIYKKVSMEKN